MDKHVIQEILQKIAKNLDSKDVRIVEGGTILLKIDPEKAIEVSKTEVRVSPSLVTVNIQFSYTL